jgi:hypothetical protein
MITFGGTPCVSMVVVVVVIITLGFRSYNPPFIIK